MDLKELVEKAVDGDAGAFGELYKRYAPQMRYICSGILKNDRDAVDDIVHYAFILAFASLKNLRNPDRFPLWMSAIIKNASLKYLRMKKSSPVSLSLLPDDCLCDIETPNVCDNELLRADIFSAIESLPEGYGKVFRLSVMEGFSHKEISEILGIEPHSSSSQLSRAKAMLRKKLYVYRALAMVFLAFVAGPLYRFLVTGDQRCAEKRFPGMRHYGMISLADTAKTDTVNVGSDGRTISSACENLIAGTKKEYDDTCIVSVSDTLYMADSSVSFSDTIDAVLADYDSVLMTDVFIPDTFLSSDIPVRNSVATDVRPKKPMWKMVLAGSVGPALARNVYKLLATGADMTEPDGPDQPSFIPKYVGTWEEYYSYLSENNSGMSPDTLTLMDIAKNNTGPITEYERHEKPLTVGLSFSRRLSGRWSIETGLQYSVLKSVFSMGGSSDNIRRTQKIHYAGLPLRMSYNIVSGDKLSLYGSAGVVMNIPVYGSSDRYLVTDSVPVRFDSKHVGMPLQWSVNIGTGLQYKLSGGVGLYLEPTLNWHIPSGGRSHTVWTEHPFTFTVPFGVRFTW